MYIDFVMSWRRGPRRAGVFAFLSSSSEAFVGSFTGAPCFREGDAFERLFALVVRMADYVVVTFDGGGRLGVALWSCFEGTVDWHVHAHGAIEIGLHGPDLPWAFRNA
jgi:hypothetical protein